MSKLTIITILIIITSSFTACQKDENNVKISNSDNFVKINDTKIKVEIADSPAEWHQGLSGRKELCKQCGMLFIFPDKKQRTFVMRLMHFPLDIIWITDGKIVKIDKNLPPEGTEPKEHYSSGQPVNYVLELNAGFTLDNMIQIGDKVQISINYN